MRDISTKEGTLIGRTVKPAMLDPQAFACSSTPFSANSAEPLTLRIIPCKGTVTAAKGHCKPATINVRQTPCIPAVQMSSDILNTVVDQFHRTEDIHTGDMFKILAHLTTRAMA
jgi:hypothetical protein